MFPCIVVAASVVAFVSFAFLFIFLFLINFFGIVINTSYDFGRYVIMLQIIMRNFGEFVINSKLIIIHNNNRRYRYALF